MGNWQTPASGIRQYVPSNPYCAVSDVVMEFRGKLPGQASDDWNRLQQVIERASRFVDRWRGRDFFQHDHTVSPITIDENYPGNFKTEIHLINRSPILDMTSFRVLVGSDELDQTQQVSVQNADWGDLTASVILKPASWISVYTGSPGNTWGLNRSNGTVMTVYGLFGYDQRAKVDDQGNVESYGASNDYSATNIPDCPLLIRTAAAKVAAAMSGDMRREFVDMAGVKQTVVSNRVDDIAREILGPKVGTMLS